MLFHSSLEERVFPFIILTVCSFVVFALICSMISVASCSISMEGKNYWMLKTLPIRAKDIFKAKILMNLSLAAPFVLVSSLMCCFSIKTSLLQSIWLVCIPMVYMCTNIVLSLAVNLKLYVLTGMIIALCVLYSYVERQELT